MAPALSLASSWILLFPCCVPSVPLLPVFGSSSIIYQGNSYAFLWFQIKHFHFPQEVRSPCSVYMVPWAALFIKSADFVAITRFITYFFWIVGTVFLLVFLLSITVTGHGKFQLNIERRKGKRRKNIKCSKVQNLHTFYLFIYYFFHTF